MKTHRPSANEVDQTFFRAVQAIAPALKAADTSGEDRLEAMQELYNMGEAIIAFDILIENIGDFDIDVSEQTKHDLKFLATKLDQLDHPANGGKYW